MFTERHRWHFGVLSFTGIGHLNPLIVLSQELKGRGHRLTFFEKPKIEGRVRGAGLEFFPIGESKSYLRKTKPAPSTPGIWAELSTLRFNLKRIKCDIETYLRELPPVLTRAEVNVLIINEIALTGPTVAQLLGLPYFIISTSVPHNLGWKAFPWFSGYKYSDTWCSQATTVLLEISALRMRGPIRWALNRYRKRVGLGSVREVSKVFPHLAQITQMPQCLDLPRKTLHSDFFYTGPFVSKNPRPSVVFPWERLDGRPIIYASLGTTRNVQPHVFRMIAEACQDLELQLVLSLGNRFEPASFADLPGKPLLVQYAPQLELLRHAELVITHGGPNTVFETLMEGKPMIAIPMAYDQPAIAARLARLNLAVVLPIMRLSARQIRHAIIAILNDPAWRGAAVAMQSLIRSIDGPEKAADVIENALEKYALGRRREIQMEQLQVD